MKIVTAYVTSAPEESRNNMKYEKYKIIIPILTLIIPVLLWIITHKTCYTVM